MKPKPVFVCLIGTMSTFALVMASPKGGTTATTTTRCFCNEANCVRTGYMCKSTLNLCYSVVILNADGGGHRFRSMHGCADTQPETSPSACSTTGSDRHAEGDAAAFSSTNGNERLVCCSHDMCNYVDGAGVLLLSAAIVTNGSSDDTSSSNFDRQHPAAAAAVFDSALWFRVAVIAVPLVGLFLLILLVVAAVRMLRGDHHLLLLRRRRRRRHRRQIVVSVGEERRFVCEKSLRREACGARNGGVGGLCPNHHGYPTTTTTTCWLEFSDDDCCGARTCAHHRDCVRVSDCAVGIHAPLAPSSHSYSRRIHAKTPWMTTPTTTTGPSSQERFPFPAAAAAVV